MARVSDWGEGTPSLRSSRTRAGPPGVRLIVEVAASVFGRRPDGSKTVALNPLGIRAELNKAKHRAG